MFTSVRVFDLAWVNVFPIEMSNVNSFIWIHWILDEQCRRFDDVFGVEDGDVFVVCVEFVHFVFSFIRQLSVIGSERLASTKKQHVLWEPRLKNISSTR